MKDIAVIFIICINLIEVEAQSLQTGQINEKANEFISSFKAKSVENYKKLLFNKSDYLYLAELLNRNIAVNDEEIKREYRLIEENVKSRFNNIREKGESKGIKWKEIEFQGIVFDSYELNVPGFSNEEILIVDSHIRFKYRERFFTILGIQFWLINDELKIKGDEIVGLYEINLTTYVPTEDMYLEDMEEEGY